MIDDEEAWLIITAEWVLLNTLEGGCTLPICVESLIWENDDDEYDNFKGKEVTENT